MGQKQAQEFWDALWSWERYEVFPGEEIDDPHLVIVLGGQVEAAGEAADAELLRRFDHCVGRVLNQLTNLLPRSGEDADLGEFRLWLEFGLDPGNRGHDGTVTPIIDANSLFVFLRFNRYAIEYCDRHNLPDLKSLWESIESVANEVEQQHAGSQRESRFLT